MPLDGDYEESPAQWVRDQVALYERSGGTESTLMRGMPVVLLTMRGAQSGKLRKVPLMRVEHDGSYLAVASMGGAPKHPQWYYNLVAHPELEVRDGTDVWQMRARLVTGAEKQTWWERAAAAFPDYAKYQERAGREIPVFVLEPVSAS